MNKRLIAALIAAVLMPSQDALAAPPSSEKVSAAVSRASLADPVLGAALAQAADAQAQVPAVKARPAEEDRRREHFIKESKRDIMSSRDPRKDCIDGLLHLEYDKSVAGILCFSNDPAQAYGCFLDGMGLSGGRRPDEIIEACRKFPVPEYCANAVSGGHWESRDCFGRFGVASIFTCDRHWVSDTRTYRVRCDQR